MTRPNHGLSHPSDGSSISLTSNGREPAKLDAGIGLKVELDPKHISNGFDSNTSDRNETRDDEDEWKFRAAGDETRTDGESAMVEGNMRELFLEVELKFESEKLYRKLLVLLVHKTRIPK
ncbi:hypothetical protein SAY86_012199 [Trapa natans]|uniref:Uncharacterized protein n=1 Tax=Trapa natans TaxID=22666 RepID=A0AAN7LWR7_TRANT|nr:hypothetical protein SAY86_012199 [Trapa natans]